MFYPNSAWWFYQPVLVFISVPLWFVVLLGNLVRDTGIEPVSYRFRGGCSPRELIAQNLVPIGGLEPPTPTF